MSPLEPAVVDQPRLRPYGFPSLEALESPAAGAAFSEAVDGAFYVRLLSVHVRLVTSAVVAERGLFLEYRDQAGNRYMLAGAAVTQSASSTNDYLFDVWQPVTSWPVDASILVPLKAALLEPTHSWRIGVTNMDAGDALSRIRTTRERFYTDTRPPGP